MFLVKDNFNERVLRIKGFLETEPPIAIILSAVHFEWTIRRVIIALGKSPNRNIRNELRNCHGLEKYKKIWKKEVACNKVHLNLTEVVYRWPDFRDAFEERHRLVHGVSSCSEKFARPKVELILSGANDIRKYCKNSGVDIYTRIPIRRIKLK